MDSPLTKETSEAVYKSQNLRNLSVVTEEGVSIPPASLPNLIRLEILCKDGSGGLQLLRGATFGKLESLDFYLCSGPTNDFLEAFKDAALSSSIQNTLSAICLSTDSSWNPDYSPLLPFTQLVNLKIQFSCDDNCTRANDDTIIDLSRAMPKLQLLELGDPPCDRFAGGVTAKGLTALAHNCPGLFFLCVHFQVASLSDPPTVLETTRYAGYSTSRTGCALMELGVGEILVPEGSAPMVALTLLRIFPQIKTLDSTDEGWCVVEDLICRSKQIVDCSSKYYHLTIPRNSSLTLLRGRFYDR